MTFRTMCLKKLAASPKILRIQMISLLVPSSTVSCAATGSTTALDGMNPATGNDVFVIDAQVLHQETMENVNEPSRDYATVNIPFAPLDVLRGTLDVKHGLILKTRG